MLTLIRKIIDEVGKASLFLYFIILGITFVLITVWRAIYGEEEN